jgi:hypothetical protein
MGCIAGALVSGGEVNFNRMVQLRVMHYNFCKIHSTLRVTPAMACGLSREVWEIEDLLKLID